jgi:hypothetical protein
MLIFCCRTGQLARTEVLKFVLIRRGRGRRRCEVETRRGAGDRPDPPTFARAGSGRHGVRDGHGDPVRGRLVRGPRIDAVRLMSQGAAEFAPVIVIWMLDPRRMPRRS